MKYFCKYIQYFHYDENTIILFVILYYDEIFKKGLNFKEIKLKKGAGASYVLV